MFLCLLSLILLFILQGGAGNLYAQLIYVEMTSCAKTGNWVWIPDP